MAAKGVFVALVVAVIALVAGDSPALTAFLNEYGNTQTSSSPITVIPLGALDYQLQWTGDPSLQYSVSLSANGVTLPSVSASTTSVTFTNLAPSTTYLATITAPNVNLQTSFTTPGIATVSSNTTWNSSSSWTPALIPCGSDAVVLGAASGPYVVQIFDSVAVRGVEFLQPGAGLTFAPGQGIYLLSDAQGAQASTFSGLPPCTVIAPTPSPPSPPPTLTGASSSGGGGVPIAAVAAGAGGGGALIVLIVVIIVLRRRAKNRVRVPEAYMSVNVKDKTDASVRSPGPAWNTDVYDAAVNEPNVQPWAGGYASNATFATYQSADVADNVYNYIPGDDPTNPSGSSTLKSKGAYDIPPEPSGIYEPPPGDRKGPTTADPLPGHGRRATVFEKPPLPTGFDDQAGAGTYEVPLEFTKPGPASSTRVRPGKTLNDYDYGFGSTTTSESAM